MVWILQDDVTRLLLQKAYLNDPFPPEIILHKTKKVSSFDNQEIYNDGKAYSNDTSSPGNPNQTTSPGNDVQNTKGTANIIQEDNANEKTKLNKEALESAFFIAISNLYNII